MEAPWPLLGAHFYMKKHIAYLNNFQRKKLFCVQTLTKLAELTVPLKEGRIYIYWKYF
jgi:hypothetical protein